MLTATATEDPVTLLWHSKVAQTVTIAQSGRTDHNSQKSFVALIPDGLVGEVQGVLWRLVEHVRDELVAHEDVRQQVGQHAVALALTVVQLK